MVMMIANMRITVFLKFSYTGNRLAWTLVTSKGSS